MKATTKKIWFFYPAHCNTPRRLLNNLFLSSRFLTIRVRPTTTTPYHHHTSISWLQMRHRHSFIQSVSHRVVVVGKGSGHNILTESSRTCPECCYIVKFRARSGLADEFYHHHMWCRHCYSQNGGLLLPFVLHRFRVIRMQSGYADINIMQNTTRERRDMKEMMMTMMEIIIIIVIKVLKERKSTREPHHHHQCYS